MDAKCNDGSFVRLDALIFWVYHRTSTGAGGLSQIRKQEKAGQDGACGQQNQQERSFANVPNNPHIRDQTHSHLREPFRMLLNPDRASPRQEPLEASMKVFWTANVCISM